jgi:hypothetical protein
VVRQWLAPPYMPFCLGSAHDPALWPNSFKGQARTKGNRLSVSGANGGASRRRTPVGNPLRSFYVNSETKRHVFFYSRLPRSSAAYFFRCTQKLNFNPNSNCCGSNANVGYSKLGTGFTPGPKVFGKAGIRSDKNVESSHPNPHTHLRRK